MRHSRQHSHVSPHSQQQQSVAILQVQEVSWPFPSYKAVDRDNGGVPSVETAVALLLLRGRRGRILHLRSVRNTILQVSRERNPAWEGAIRWGNVRAAAAAGSPGAGNPEAGSPGEEAGRCSIYSPR